MSYDGHRITINGTNVPSEWIEKGTFNTIPKKRVVSSWTDGNLVEHHDVLTSRKMVISFSIRVRTLADQDRFKSLFVDSEGITVQFWDDRICDYRTGSFYMDDITFAHINSQANSLLYDATPIKLTEY